MRSLLKCSWLAGLGAALLLTGCAVTPPRVPGELVPVEQIERWQARGRIGVSGPQGGGSGSFDWRQDDDAANVQIRGPIGIGSVRLQVRGQPQNPQIEVQTGDGETLHADAAWNELEARLGAGLPAGNLRYWLVGMAAPGEHRWDESTLEQDGWRIEYQDYSDRFGAQLPMRLRASSGEARVRIVIDRWQLGQ